MPPRITKKGAPELAAEALFRAYKQAYMRQFGFGPLSSGDIDTAGRAEFKTRWGGVGDQHMDLRPDKYYIVNTSYTPRSKGVHWVGVVVTRSGIIHMYDSFARNGLHTLSRLAARVKKLGGAGRHIIESDTTDAEQKGDSAVCGHLSLAWLSVVRDLGLKAALRV